MTCVRTAAGSIALLVIGCAGADATPQPGAQTLLAIVDVTVIPATGAPPLGGATVLIRGDRITAVGAAATLDIPAGARVIDGSGKFLIPGLIEMHGHVSKTRASALGLFIANGVTTVRDMGGDHQELLRWRREVRSGERVGPRLLLAGPYLESASNVERMRRDPPEARVEPFERTRIPVGSPADARRVVDSLATLELDYLKIRTVQDRDTYLAINRAADAHGLRLVGHVSGLSPELVLEAGQDGIEHFFYPLLDSLTEAERAGFWRQFAERGVAIVPTLVTLDRTANVPVARLQEIVDDSLGAIEPRRRYLSRFLVLDWREQVLEQSDARNALLRRLYPSLLRNLREMHASGMDVLVGSDVAVLNVFPGSSLHEEMALFAKDLGLSPADVLERTTRLSARFLGIADSVGTIEPGRIADLVLLDADPLADIRNVARISAVVVRGEPSDRAALDALLAAVEAAGDRRVNDWPRRPP